ncbi:alkaline phosphatase family protein [Rhodopirellula sp. JC740]|uniref:Alkaline phosphatase family protein n=1 Tax=Rhodopirellula halodulae TaxID=2894198 RepID=A0ABS8NK07_9BACT|nr:alkaline phosphatase family protein [Rhodopirellula sp. JC740]MCC9643875.1 alkaline phosphatase family protein [Rhodopirellula sp. JC740]
MSCVLLSQPVCQRGERGSRVHASTLVKPSDRRRSWLILSWLFLVSCGATLQAKQPKVLMIGIDGLRRDGFVAANTPHLDALADRGTLCLDARVTSDAVPQSDTVSGPGWTTFLTGVWADRHGVTDNSFRGRNTETGPHGFALAKLGQPEVRTSSYLCWTPLRDHVTTDADIDVVVTPGESDSVSSAWKRADQSLAWSAVPTLANDHSDWTFVYFGSVDETGHGHGFHPSVPEYLAAIENVDRLVGELMDAVHRRPTYDSEDWLVLVSTDHGGEGTGHGGGRENVNVYTVPMIVSGDAANPGTIVPREEGSAPPATVDLVPLALHHLGISIDPAWKLAGSVDGWLKTTADAR